MPLRKSRKINTICAVAGRSAGHIIPCLTRVQNLIKEETEEQDVLFFSTNSSLDKNVSKDFSFITQHIPLDFQGTPQGKWYKYPLFLWQLSISTFKAFFWLLRKRPSVIISTGGYVSIPVCIMGYLLGIRVELFELNAVPGRATLFLAPFSSVIYVCFSQTQQFFKKERSVLTPYPLRFSTEKKLLSEKKVLSTLGLFHSKKTVLILGGSQGSLFINEIFQNLFNEYPDLKKIIQLIHQTGQENNDSLKALYKQQKIDAYVFGYHTNPEIFYSSAHIVVCRAGAGTLFETLSFKKKCIIIPLETATTAHQLDNAQALIKEYPNLLSILRQNTLSKNSKPLAIQLQSYLASMS